MRKVSKYLFIIISALILITSIPVNTFAVQGDVEAPVVTLLTLDKHTVYPGDIVTITCKATDDSEISLDSDSDYKTFLYLTNGTNYSDLFYFSKQSDGVYTAQLEIPQTYVNGFYFFSYFVITDVEGNEYSSYSSATYRDIYFEVKGATNDRKAPTVKTISIDKNSVSPGDEVTVTCEITDENDLDTDPFSSFLYLKNGNYISDPFAFVKKERGVYSATITIDQFYVNGLYQFGELSLTDIVGNQYYTSDASKYPDINFEVTNASDDRDAPIIDEISIDKHDVSEGDTVTITSVINDENSIACDSLNHYLILKNGTFYSDLFIFNKVAENTYSATLPITKNYVDGKYSVNYYIVSDLIGNKQISYSAADYPEICITVSGNPANEYYRKPGWFMADEKWYYNNSKGELHHGWLLLNNKWRYMDLTTGEMRTGWIPYKGEWYYMDQANDGVMATGWRYDSGNWYYMNSDGVRQSGWINLNKKWRYLDPETGAMKTGWLFDNGKWYYLDPTNDGIMATGWRYVSDNWFYMDPSGVRLIGWLYQNNKWRYLDPSTGAMKTGWVSDNGKQYYVDPANDGIMVTGWKQIDGLWYYFDSNGTMHTGWLLLNNKWRYMDLESGALYSGWLNDKSKVYYLDPLNDGIMYVGWKLFDGLWYYFNTSGILQTKWLQLNGKWRYLDPDTGAMYTGWLQLNDKVRYLDPDNDGIMTTGWKYLDNNWYYFDTSNDGIMATGWRYVGGKWYYFNAEGKMSTGWLLDNGKWYYLNSSGAMQTGWLYWKESWYYLYSNGVMLTGWQYINGAWYYLDNSGIMLTGWQNIDNTWYYLLDSGKMATETVSIKGYQHVFHTNGAWIDTSAMDTKAATYSSSTNYLILVSLSNKVTKIYKKSGASWNVEKAYLCSVGDPFKGWQTITGSFYIGQSSWNNPTWKGYSFNDTEGHTLYYWTRFCDSFLFHSVLYDGGTWNETTSGNGLGQAISHGCVRLRWQNAKWIYDNIPYGTKVVVY